MSIRAIIISIVAVSLACSDQRDSPDDYLARNVSVDGKNYAFRVFVPKGRDANAKLPVMLYLHGSGTRGDDNLAQVDGFNSAIAPVKDKINFIVVVPQCRNDDFWGSSEMEKYAVAALDQSVKEFNGDEQKLYLAGFSLGGYGTFHIAAANPGKFAALMPVAGGVVGDRPIRPEHREVMIPEILKMLDSPEPYKAVATAIGHTPVWVFHGAKDDAVPVDFSRKMVEALKNSGNANVRYTEYENDGHMIFGKSFSEPGFFEWLAPQQLDIRK